MDKKIIVVMPVANEEATMQTVIDEVMSLPYTDLHLYVILDSYSKDNTENIVRKAEEQYKGRTKCVFYEESKGLISCYLYGFKLALEHGADYVIEMDGGGSHNPKEIPRFIEMLNKGYECVWGSRFMKGGSETNTKLYRRILSKGGTILSNIVLGTKLKDMTSGFEAFDAKSLKRLKMDKVLSKGHMYQTEIRYYFNEHKVIEVPINYIGGKSSLKAKSVTEALKLLFKLKKNKRNVFV